ncbi:hypothetical protein HK103_002125 [Boothiomyces macroporosus]|uniref:Uncharacterized protein n=1 Tax=Boothiomyces macroporosus TaxID=261099 RepID=A0AAD5Y6W7_9FUNG|nr:hypothetical protein HK103_002125 [Boothiomyces macroporosus]
MSLNAKDKFALIAVVGAVVTAVVYFISTPNTVVHRKKRVPRKAVQKKPKQENREEIQMEAIASREIERKVPIAKVIETKPSPTFQEIHNSEISNYFYKSDSGIVGYNHHQDLAFQYVAPADEVLEMGCETVHLETTISATNNKNEIELVIEPEYMSYEESNFCYSSVSLYLNNDWAYVSPISNAMKADVEISIETEPVVDLTLSKSLEQEDVAVIDNVADVSSNERNTNCGQDIKPHEEVKYLSSQQVLHGERSNYFYQVDDQMLLNYTQTDFEETKSAQLHHQSPLNTKGKSTKNQPASVMDAPSKSKITPDLLQHSEISNQFYHQDGNYLFNVHLLHDYQDKFTSQIGLSSTPETIGLKKDQSPEDFVFHGGVLLHSEESSMFYVEDGEIAFNHLSLRVSHLDQLPLSTTTAKPSMLLVDECRSPSAASTEGQISPTCSPSPQEKTPSSPKPVFQAPKNIAPNISKIVELYEKEAFKRRRSQSEPVKCNPDLTIVKLSNQKSQETLVNDDDSMSDITAVQ